MKLLVLWIFFSQPWAIGSMEMTPGWFATRYVYTEGYGELCKKSGETWVDAHIAITEFACVDAEEDPPGELAHIIRRTT